MDAYQDHIAEMDFLRSMFTLLRDMDCLTTKDTLLIAAQARNLLLIGQRQPVQDEDCPPRTINPEEEDPPFPGWTIRERITQLGYCLTEAQAIPIVAHLSVQARHYWKTHYRGSPAQYRGEDWYGRDDLLWGDQMIHTYLGSYPALRRRATEQAEHRALQHEGGDIGPAIRHP